LLAGAIAIAPLQALAQEAAPSGNTPAADAVGPRELQNFSLSGTITRPSEQPVPVQAAPQKRPPRTQAQSASPAPATTEAASVRPSSSPSRPKRTETASADLAPAPRPERVAEPTRASPSSSISVALPKVDGGSTAAAPSSTPASAPVFAPDPAPAGTLAPEHKFPILPWLLAAIALGAGGAFLFWRKHSGREALAGGPPIDLFVAPEPAPAPAPRPTPPPPAPPTADAPAPPIPGIVSTRLRPWVDIGFQPIRCVLEDQRVVVEFDIELFNSGSAPARAVLVEAILINAGPSQDSEIERFFSNPVGQGERIVAIPPLKRVSLRTQVIAPREQIQAYELGGRQVFVPLIAFNTLYRWSGGEGQTSASYLLGRDTKAERMGPFRLDLGPRIFRGLAAHLMPTGVRR
jgi:hypothetical protein